MKSLRLLFDLNLRELTLHRCDDGCVFRLSAGASQRIPGVCGVFDRIAPGFWKYKIAFRQLFPFFVCQLSHADTCSLFQFHSVLNPSCPVG